jgi:LPPG:FO 2-phospho-L-lactate transferase
MSRSGELRYAALSGGIGGAKLSLGLAHLLGERLTVIVNTGDDFEHVGLCISPDVDTTLYTLGGMVNPEAGWGRRDETWNFMQAIADLGGPDWFKLGDRDLATHVDRTRRLKAGETLTQITAHLCDSFGISARILPMTDGPVRTVIHSDRGDLAFQEYFVRDRCAPIVHSIRYDGAASARPTDEIVQALSSPDLAGIIICPSNPWLSIDPILAVSGMRALLKSCGAPVVAVSPIVAGRALKGPTAKIMTELGLNPSAASIAHHYAGLIDGMIVDASDASVVADLTVPAAVTNTVMQTFDDKAALARDCLSFCESIARGEHRRGPRRHAEAAG